MVSTIFTYPCSKPSHTPRKPGFTSNLELGFGEYFDGYIRHDTVQNQEEVILFDAKKALGLSGGARLDWFLVPPRAAQRQQQRTMANMWLVPTPWLGELLQAQETDEQRNNGDLPHRVLPIQETLSLNQGQSLLDWEHSVWEVRNNPLNNPHGPDFWYEDAQFELVSMGAWGHDRHPRSHGDQNCFSRPRSSIERPSVVPSFPLLRPVGRGLVGIVPPLQKSAQSDHGSSIPASPVRLPWKVDFKGIDIRWGGLSKGWMGDAKPPTITQRPGALSSQRAGS